MIDVRARRSLLVVVALLAVVLATAAVGAKGAQDFTLINKTGVEIHAVYVSPHDADDWEENILEEDTLPAGESIDVSFDRSETAKMWDLRVEDKDGNSIEWENLNLLEISEVTLFYKNGKAWAETK